MIFFESDWVAAPRACSDGSAAGASAMAQAKNAALEGVVEEAALLQWAKDNGKQELIKILERQEPN